MIRILAFVKEQWPMLPILGLVCLAANLAGASLDPGLEAAIRDSLGKPTGQITTADLQGLISLDAGSRSITNLAGIEAATNLQSFDLRYNSVLDSSPLQQLQHLTVLSVRQNPLTNLQAIAGLTNVTFLDMSHDLASNATPDLSGLTPLTQLSTLVLAGCGYTNATPVKVLYPLQVLYLQNNLMANVADISGLTNLRSLYLPGNHVADATPLTNLQVLSTLQLERNQCTNSSFLSSLTSLSRISLANNNLSEFKLPSVLSNALYLDLSHNSITSVASIALTPQLSQLDISYNSLSNLSALSSLGLLVSLDFSSNRVADVSTLSVLTNLQRLRFAGNQVTNAVPLASLINLQELEARQNQLPNLDFAAGMTNLRILSCPANNISNIVGAQNLFKLTTLDLHDNAVTNASAIGGLTNLVSLNLAGNPIADHAFLSNLTQLTVLGVGRTAISNLSALAAFSRLTSLKCANTPVTSIGMLTNDTQLAELDVSGTRITSLAPVQSLSSLKTFRMDGLSSAVPPNLGLLTSLTFFSAQRSGLTNAAFVSNCPTIKDLYLADNALRDVSPLTNLPQLVHLRLSYNVLTNISALTVLSNLVQLDLDNNYLDLAPTSAAMSVIQTLTQRGVIVNYQPQQAPPTLSAISNQTIGENGASRTLFFTYTPDSIVMTAASSNPTLISNNTACLDVNVHPGRIVVTPNTGRTGLALITLTATTSKGVAVTNSFSVTVVPSTPVSVPDSGLAETIRMALDRPVGQLNSFDIASLTDLEFPNGDIVTLAGLQGAYNLKRLDISLNPVTDLTALLSLTNLQWLSVAGLDLTNLPQVAGLTQLTNLDISANSITDCSVLQNLKQLRYLNTSGNPFCALDCISGLTNLNELYAEDCLLTNCQFAANLPQLQVLALDQNYLQTINPLGNLTNLTELYLSLNQVTNFAPVSNLFKLNALTLSFNSLPVADPSIFSASTNLTQLYLAGDGISSLGFLSGLTNLTDLNVSYNNITNVSLLAGLRGLERLILRGNHVTNAASLTNLTALRILDLCENQLQSLTPFLGMTNLDNLDISLNGLNVSAGSGTSLTISNLLSHGIAMEYSQVNAAPTISFIDFQLIPPNATSQPLPFTVSDADSDPCTLVVTAHSSNQAVISDAGLVISGICSNLALSMTPVTGQTGTAVITLSVRDLLGASNHISFNVEVLVDGPVSVPDPALGTLLRGILQKPYPMQITLYDIRNLEFLYFGNYTDAPKISSLQGLQPAIYVVYADFSNHNIQDGAPLASMTNLETLILDGNPLTNLVFASSLQALTELSLHNTGVQDVSRLASLTNLDYLDLSYDNITNASLLAGLRNLTVLNLEATGLKSLAFVTNMTKLESLSIAHNEITDLRPLLSLPHLTYVDIADDGLNLSAGSSNASVIASLQTAGVYIPLLAQSSQPIILTGSPNLSGSNKVAISFTSYPWRTYTLQGTTNLAQWMNLATLNSTSMVSLFTNVDRGNYPREFFRVAWLASTSAPVQLTVTLGIPVRNTNGTVTVQAFGTAGKTAVLQASTNCTQWTAVATNSATNTVMFTDPTAAGLPRRFYRVWVP